MNHKRKTSDSMKQHLKRMTVFYLTLNVFGNIHYLSEGALIQPTLSLTTSVSQSGKKYVIIILTKF